MHEYEHPAGQCTLGYVNRFTRDFFPPFYRIGIVPIADDLVFLFEGCSKASLTFSKKTASLVLFHYYYYYFNLMTLCTTLPVNVNTNRTHSLCWWWTSTQIWSRLWQKTVQIWILSSVVHVTEMVALGILVCSVQDLLKMKKRDGWWWWWRVVGICMFILLSAMKFGCTSQGGAGGRMVSNLHLSVRAREEISLGCHFGSIC